MSSFEATQNSGIWVAKVASEDKRDAHDRANEMPDEDEALG